MRVWWDKTGFPLAEVPDTGQGLHLLPVAKFQFERFLAEPDPHFDDRWYEEVCRLNDRASIAAGLPAERERVFLTGLLPAEAATYAAWVGAEMPTAALWRAAFQTWGKLSVSALPDAVWSHPVSGRLARLLRDALRPRTVRDFSLMDGGIVEWLAPSGEARDRDERVGVGSPRREFLPNLWHPAADFVRPINPKARLRVFGLRLSAPSPTGAA